MKQFGTTHMKQRFCKCCVSMDNPRAKVKKETEKLIKEEQDEVVHMGNIVLKYDKYGYCTVCGDYQNIECATEC